ncbi:hypothetical protein F66182_15518, partial [Fusarium sp. NRRL 66182]
MPGTIRPAFANRDEPRIAYGVPFPEITASQAATYFHASKVYVICSGSLSRNTNALERLKNALGDKFAGVRIGMKPHTLWSEVVEIINDAKSVGADLLVTLGAGSLTDAAKIVAFALANDVTTFDGLYGLTTNVNKDAKQPAAKDSTIKAS